MILICKMDAAAQGRHNSETSYLGKGAIGSDDPELPLFKLEVIREITNGFSDSNKLGQGGFGPVYKVTNHLCFRMFVCVDLSMPQHAHILQIQSRRSRSEPIVCIPYLLL